MAKRQQPDILLTSERDMVTGTAPYQFRPFIYINKQLRVRLLGYNVRPRSLVLAVLLVVGVGYAAVRWLLLAGRR